MKTGTKYFGEIEYSEEQILTFSRGLFGFEDEHSFLLLPLQDSELFILQSAVTPQLAFVLMDPFSLDPHYAPVLQKDELKVLQAEKSQDLYYYVLCAVKDPVADSTVNMQCPIAIREETRQAMQVILDGGRHHMRHRLSEFGKSEGDGLC